MYFENQLRNAYERIEYLKNNKFINDIHDDLQNDKNILINNNNYAFRDNTGSSR